MSQKCHLSALELALLSIENKLIIFNLTIFNYGVSIISFLINPKSPFFSLFLSVSTPTCSPGKPLYMRDLTNYFY